MGQAAPKIVFVVMSAVSRADTVDQLARALAPHPVLVHHDFSQTPVFPLTAPNARFVPAPERTGWAVFGFCRGIIHSLRTALATMEFDYLQTLSPSCLPIRPMRDFEAHVAGPHDAHFAAIDLLADRDALMSVGYRAFTPEHTLRHRILRRLCAMYFGQGTGRREEEGVWLRSGRTPGALAWLALVATKAASWPWCGRHPFGARLRPYYGTSWFGARRAVVAGLVDLYEPPELRAWFSRLRIADEFLFPTLLMHLCPRKGPLNHFVQTYDEAHPGILCEQDFARLRRSGAWFARKFPDDPTAPVRLAALRELAGVARLEEGVLAAR
ncbi:hypothetical protein WG922_07080 [Ramlibacter sp. AN1015]|uniref:hypothetical protein n=1 Tax=Ramlibacter sp. AN1015 TaxID=3133428 RepID=UPI0030C416EF